MSYATTSQRYVDTLKSHIILGITPLDKMDRLHLWYVGRGEIKLKKALQHAAFIQLRREDTDFIKALLHINPGRPNPHRSIDYAAHGFYQPGTIIELSDLIQKRDEHKTIAGLEYALYNGTKTAAEMHDLLQYYLQDYHSQTQIIPAVLTEATPLTK